MDDDDLDLSLLARWRAGDPAAGTALFRRHELRLINFFRNKIPHVVGADLRQDIWVAIMKSNAIESCVSFRAYLLGVARFTLFQYWRSSGGKQLDPITSSFDLLGPSFTQEIDRSLRSQRLHDALQYLPLDTRLLLEMRYLEEMTEPELAQVYGVPLGTIKRRLSDARKALAAQLDRAAKAAKSAD